MNPKTMSKWERIRAKGKTRYVVIRTVIVYPLVFTAALINHLITGAPIFSLDNALEGLLLTCFVILLLPRAWSHLERQYQEALASQPQEDEQTESE